MNATARKALVTGSTSGIGRAIAHALAANGAHVVVTGRDARRGAEVVEEIRSARGRAQFVSADLSSMQSISDLAASCEKLLGGIDILVNNAGIYSFGPTPQAREGDFHGMYATNVRAPFFLTAKLAPGMVARGSGRIVNVTTMGPTSACRGPLCTAPRRRHCNC